MTRESIQLTSKIADRAISMDINLHEEKMSLVMDLEAANDQFALKLEELLRADKFNFSHDVLGIQYNLDRNTRTMQNCFVPRFATK